MKTGIVFYEHKSVHGMVRGNSARSRVEANKVPDLLMKCVRTEYLIVHWRLWY